MKSPPTDIAGYDPTRDATGFEWKPDRAQHTLDFFSDCLVLTSGRQFAGKPFKLEPWQANFVATLHGWRRPDGGRRYREALFFVPRKNGKTETGAGLALYGLCCDNEAKPEVYSAAKTRDQASRVFEPASIMVRNSPMLQSRLRIVESSKRIVFAKNNGYYQAISADAATSHGKNPHTVLFDELHTQPNRNLYDGLKSGMGARTQPLFVSMTTAGYDRHSICYEVWKHAKAVRDGIICDPEFLPMLYQYEDGDDWTSEDVWRRCNPNLGVTISEEFLRSEYRRAVDVPAYENTFRNLYLNQWTQSAVRWFSLTDWDACNAELPNLNGCHCWAGLDMSATQDVTAFVMAFPLDDGVIALIPHFWIPEDSAEKKERIDRVPYGQWRKQGLITFTSGATVDADKVRLDINRLNERYAIQEIAADRWNATQILVQLAEQDGFNVVQHGQGIAGMTGPSKEFEKLVVGHKLIHGGNPVLRWMADNVMVEIDAAENIKPTKAKSTGRIDGIVAAIMACGRALCGEIVGYWDPSVGV